MPMKLKMNKQRWIILILALITIAAVTVTLVVVLRPKETPPEPDYAPQQVEPNADPIGDGGEKLSQPEGGGAVSLTYSNEVTLTLADKTVSLMFQNPTRSNQDMVLELVIADKVIVRSGRLEPGYKVESLSGVDTAGLSAGTYEGKFRVLYYNADSGEKGVVNTEIPITVTVK